MNIGGLVVDNSNRQKAKLLRIAPVAAATRDPAGNAHDDAQRFLRRSDDAAPAASSDRRGVVPEVRSKSTMIIYDKRAVDRREIADRRARQILAAPLSEFVAQAVAREGMLLDLRPDRFETRRARSAYGNEPADEQTPVTKRIDFTV